MTRETFAAAMTVLGSTFRQVFDDAALEGYWMALGDAGDDEFKLAVRRALRQCRFMPVPAELRAFAREECAERSLAAAAAHEVAEVDAWLDRKPGRELEAIRATIRELAEMKALDEKGG